MSGTPRPWTVERRDNEDGSITYEIWCINPPHYQRIAAINDHYDNPHAKADAELIVASVNTERSKQ